MKLSDYVACFLVEKGVKHVYVVTGGADAHLIDSIGNQCGIEYVCAQHEQGAAIMAEAAGRLTGLGVAVATSGPGATNLLTGTLCAYNDSIPVLYITGQVSTTKLRRSSGVRQLGFQEADTVNIFRPVTKYAVLVEDKMQIRYELEKAVYIAQSGRPGPVLVDIPDNLQREDIGNPDFLPSFAPVEQVSSQQVDVCELLNALRSAQRPLLIFGWGVRLANALGQVRELISMLDIPFTASWAALDAVPSEHPRFAGTFGTHSSRSGNFTVQNADFILSIGCRLDTHHTGLPSTFARGAKLAIVDIERAEIEKFKLAERRVDFEIVSDASTFMSELLQVSAATQYTSPSTWGKQITLWKRDLIDKDVFVARGEKISPYRFFNYLSKLLPKNSLVFVDTGCTLAWAFQTLKPTSNQRICSAFNCTPMGYALPAAIGGYFACPEKQVFCITGDGGLQMNIQELATCSHHACNIKIIVIDNAGYGMIRQTQDQWLGERYHAANTEFGLPRVDFSSIAKAYTLKSFVAETEREFCSMLPQLIEYAGPALLTVKIPPECKVIPQLKFGFPLEDQEPHMSRSILKRNMFLPLLANSANLDAMLCTASIENYVLNHAGVQNGIR